MPNMISIKAGTIEVQAELNNSRTAKSILRILPIKATISTWGDEIYFDIPLNMEIEDGREVVEMGDVAYWPDAPSLCLFFGRTPASGGDEIRAASPVTILGRIVGEPSIAPLCPRVGLEVKPCQSWAEPDPLPGRSMMNPLMTLA
jgi:hypothetical protein